MEPVKDIIPYKIPARSVNVGGAQIWRLLPYAKKRMVGPFIFFDHFPHTHFPAGQGMDVRPHPHIGLSTLSYLLEGQVLHHDSLGNKQLLTPGDVNWMTAGRGISHSERMPQDLNQHEYDIQLLQFWVALPKVSEDIEPNFTHHPKSHIPHLTLNDCNISLVAGEAFGHKSPVKAYSKLFFLDVNMPEGASFEFDPQDQEMAFYVVGGEVAVDGVNYNQYDFIVMPFKEKLKVLALQGSRLMVLGGHVLPEERLIYWNFVSSSKQKIEEAKEAWRDGSFPQVPGETDIIPLPPDK
ncbi:Quercetin 2,3-dioxygenase [compost metagenome]